MKVVTKFVSLGQAVQDKKQLTHKLKKRETQPHVIYACPFISYICFSLLCPQLQLKLLTHFGYCAYFVINASIMDDNSNGFRYIRVDI